jgi:hypothetical protein
MKVKILFFSITYILLSTTILSGQEIIISEGKVIAGKVMDQNGMPLEFAMVCVVSNIYCEFTDAEGAFHMLVDPAISDTISVNYFGYNPVKIGHLDTITRPLLIVMEEDTTIHRYPTSDFHASPLKFGFIGFFQVDFIRADFNQFTPFLGSYNTDFMSSATGTFGAEIAGTYKR